MSVGACKMKSKRSAAACTDRKRLTQSIFLEIPNDLYRADFEGWRSYSVQVLGAGGADEENDSLRGQTRQLSDAFSCMRRP